MTCQKFPYPPMLAAGRIFGVKTLVLVQITASNSERKQDVDGWRCDPLSIFKAVGINFTLLKKHQPRHDITWHR